MAIDAEALAAIVALVGALAWPATVLLILLIYRKTISSWLKLPSSLERRVVKAKAGGFELELNAIERLEEKIQESALKIAEEPDPKIRLELAKSLRAIDAIIPQVSDSEIEVLSELYESSIPSADFFSYWDRSDEKKIEVFQRLQTHGLVAFINEYESESVMAVTKTGKMLLERLSLIHKQDIP